MNGFSRSMTRPVWLVLLGLLSLCATAASCGDSTGGNNGSGNGHAASNHSGSGGTDDPSTSSAGAGSADPVGSGGMGSGGSVPNFGPGPLCYSDSHDTVACGASTCGSQPCAGCLAWKDEPTPFCAVRCPTDEEAKGMVVCVGCDSADDCPGQFCVVGDMDTSNPADLKFRSLCKDAPFTGMLVCTSDDDCGNGEQCMHVWPAPSMAWPTTIKACISTSGD